MDFDHRSAAVRGRRAVLSGVIAIHMVVLFILFTMPAMLGHHRPDRSLAVSLLPAVEPPPVEHRPRHSVQTVKAGSPPVPAHAEADAAPPVMVPLTAIDTPALTGQGWAAAGSGPGDLAGSGGAGSGIGNRGSDRGPASAAAPIPAMTAPASWIHRIADDELLPLLSRITRRSGVDVSLLLSCEVMLTKRVRNCRVVSEMPLGTDVSGVVERAARYFRIEPARHGAVAIDGERVNILWDVHVLPARNIETDLPPGLR